MEIVEIIDTNTGALKSHDDRTPTRATKPRRAFLRGFCILDSCALRYKLQGHASYALSP